MSAEQESGAGTEATAADQASTAAPVRVENEASTAVAEGQSETSEGATAGTDVSAQAPAEGQTPVEQNAGAEQDPPSGTLPDSASGESRASEPPAESGEKSDDLPDQVEPVNSEPDEVESESEAEAEQAPVDPNTPIGPRWFSVHTASQAAPVNLLLVDAVVDMDANANRVIERFKIGHGILHTPHEIAVRELPEDYNPTGADIDHHEALEAALSRLQS